MNSMHVRLCSPYALASVRTVCAVCMHKLVHCVYYFISFFSSFLLRKSYFCFRFCTFSLNNTRAVSRKFGKRKTKREDGKTEWRQKMHLINVTNCSIDHFWLWSSSIGPRVLLLLSLLVFFSFVQTAQQSHKHCPNISVSRR